MTPAADRLWQIMWLSVTGVGPALWSQLKNRCQKLQLGLDEAWSQFERWQGPLMLPAAVLAGVKRMRRQWSTPDEYLDYLTRKSIQVVLPTDDNFPPLLREVKGQPEILFVRGPVENLTQPGPVAVVGTRRLSAYGREATVKIASELAQAGCQVVSGFMYGVDLVAQQTAIEAGGTSVGVLGFGMDHFFPAAHEKIAQELSETGRLTLISESPPWMPPKAGLFPLRNRIVAGMSLGTVVIEAAARSGSLITANLAADYGREVMVVPGSIFQSQSQGTNDLLRQGATAVCSGAEIKQQLWGWSATDSQEQQEPLPFLTRPARDDPEQETILEYLTAKGGSTTDELKIKTGQPIEKLQSNLVILECEGLIKQIRQQWQLK